MDRPNTNDIVKQYARLLGSRGGKKSAAKRTREELIASAAHMNEVRRQKKLASK